MFFDEVMKELLPPAGPIVPDPKSANAQASEKSGQVINNGQPVQVPLQDDAVTRSPIHRINWKYVAIGIGGLALMYWIVKGRNPVMAVVKAVEKAA